MSGFYNPYDPDVHRDPYPYYTNLRDNAPVYRNEEHDFWALSRHADVGMALQDSARFSSAYGNSIEPTSWGPNAWRYASILAMDPPRHTRIRASVSRFFTQRRISSMAGLVRRTAQGLLGEALDKPDFDFVADFADHIPIQVLTTLIGVPEPDRPLIRRLAVTAVERPAGANNSPAAAIRATLDLTEYYEGLVAARAREPQDDLVSHVLADVRSRVTDDELVALLNLLTGAANDTVIELLGNAWYWAWRHPGQRRLALGGHTAGWVAETLRFDTPNQFAARRATQAITMHGVTMPEGARVLLLPGSANRDERVFPDPDRYDLRRDTSRILTFGHGRHFCLGSHLARLQATVALGEVAARVADYEIAEAGVRAVTSAEARGFVALPSKVSLR